MAGDTGNRESASVQDLQGAPEQQGLVGKQDIFDEIARNIFTTRGLAADEPWVAVIAEEFRRAMAQLNINVGPKPPAPSRTRTPNGTLMTLLAAIENGDVPVLDCHVPVRKQRFGKEEYITLAGTAFTFKFGAFDVEARYNLYPERTLSFVRIEAITLQNNQRVTSQHVDRRWLAAYAPAAVFDRFSPALQGALSLLPLRPGVDRPYVVTGRDANAELVHWPGGGDMESLGTK